MKSKIILIIKFLLASLFIYAGVYKIVDISLFKSQLYQSPLIPAFLVPYIGVLFPLLEILLSIFLIFYKRVEYTLLWLSFSIMLFFTFYLLMLYNLYDKPPCSCGGILNDMTYSTHIIFNIIFSLLALISITIYEKPKNYC